MGVSAATELRPVTKELCPNGDNKRVTEENKMEYVHLLCEYYLCGEMREQISVVLCGFWSVLPMDMLKCAGLDHRELALLICGFKDLDPTEWREHSQSPGSLSSEGHRLLEWFWELVAEMTPEKRAKLFIFQQAPRDCPWMASPGCVHVLRFQYWRARAENICHILTPVPTRWC